MLRSETTDFVKILIKNIFKIALSVSRVINQQLHHDILRLIKIKLQTLAICSNHFTPSKLLYLFFEIHILIYVRYVPVSANVFDMLSTCFFHVLVVF